MGELRPEASRLARRIALSTAVAWTAGVIGLTVLAVSMAARGYRAETDAGLHAHAMAAYGLSWFDIDGSLQVGYLEAEQPLLDPDIAITIATSSEVVWGESFEGASALVARTLADEMDIVETVAGRRVVAMPTYDDADVLRGVVVASAQRSAITAPTLRFALVTGIAALVLVAIGVLFSARLSRRVLRALLEGIRERERILAGAAHELRTPLATMLAIAETTPDEDAAGALEDIRGTTLAASGMVDRLLAWGQLADGKLEREKLRLDLLVETCLEEEDPLEGDAVVVEGDARLLQVAVRNLVENARVHGGGTRTGHRPRGAPRGTRHAPHGH